MRFESIRRAGYYLSRNPLSFAGIALVTVVALVTLAAPLIAPFPKHIGAVVDFANSSKPPSIRNVFGTDQVGRDILSRTIFGLRTSLMLAMLVLVVAVPFGTVVGLVAGYFGRAVGATLMRLTDIFLALPPLVLAMVIMGLFEPTTINMLIAIAAMWWPWNARLAYSLARSLKHEDYVEASQVVGASHAHIIFREIFPNCIPAVLVKSTLDLAFVILLISSLGFVGLGVQPPTPDLGRMVSEGIRYMPFSWWISIFPGLVIMVAVSAFSLLGDGLRDALEER